MNESSSLIAKPGNSAENEKNLAKYRNVVYYSTFVAYAMSHFSRKCYTNVKVQLKALGFDPILLSQMDTTFMFFYAIGSFFSGQLGDHFHAPTVVGLGLLGSAGCVLALTMGIWSDVESDSTWFYHFFFLSVWLVHGLMQSTGGPVNTAIMGNWFGAKNRGWIFGTWTCHQYIGNITAAIVATAILHSSWDWTWALIIPAVCNVLWGFWVMTVVPERPKDVNVVRDDEVKPVGGGNGVCYAL